MIIALMVFSDFIVWHNTSTPHFYIHRFMCILSILITIWFDPIWILWAFLSLVLTLSLCCVEWYYFYTTFPAPDHWLVPVSCSPAVNLLDSRSVIGDLGWVAYPKNGVSSTHLPVSQHFELRAGLGEHLKVSNSLDGRKDSFKVKNNRTWRA